MATTLTYLITYVGGVATSLVATFLWEVGRTRRNRRKIRRLGKQARSFDPSIDGLFRVAGWSRDRPLTEDRMRERRGGSRPPQRWLPDEAWNRYYQQLRTQTSVGPCGYVTDCDGVDWREGERSQFFSVTLSPCDYSEGIATEMTLRADPEAQARIARALADDPISFIRTAPPCPLAASIAVISHDRGSFLALRRSATVATARNVWTLGPCETLALPAEPTPGTRPEGFFSLVRRGLQEELGLSPSDYGPISISWFGYYAPGAHPWIFAQVRAAIANETVLERRLNCHSTDEASEAKWIPFNQKTIQALTNGRRELNTLSDAGKGSGPIGSEGVVVVAATGVEGRWIIHTPHAANELWRVSPGL